MTPTDITLSRQILLNNNHGDIQGFSLSIIREFSPKTLETLKLLLRGNRKDHFNVNFNEY